MYADEEVSIVLGGGKQRGREAAFGSIEPTNPSRNPYTPPPSSVCARDMRARIGERGADGFRGKSLLDAELGQGNPKSATDQKVPEPAEFRLSIRGRIGYSISYDQMA